MGTRFSLPKEEIHLIAKNEVKNFLAMSSLTLQATVSEDGQTKR